MEQGKFIVFYGINNLGKSTQADILIPKLKSLGINAEYTKYPHYNLEPSGKLINEYLRGGNPNNLSPRECQLLHFSERLQYEPILAEKLKAGIWVIAEDYYPTAIAWGTGAGVDQKFLEYFYEFIRHEDLGILFDGERFTSGIEANHKHEQDDPLMQKVRKIHLELGEKYGWHKINANGGSPQEIHESIWNIFKQKFGL